MFRVPTDNVLIKVNLKSQITKHTGKSYNIRESKHIQKTEGLESHNLQITTNRDQKIYIVL